MYWVIKDTAPWAKDDGKVYRTSGGWTKDRGLSLRFLRASDARDLILMSNWYDWVKVVRVVPKRKPSPSQSLLTPDAGVASSPVYVAGSPDAHAAKVASAHESGRVAERNRWAAELRRRARTLRQWADEARGNGHGVVARTNDICAAQLDVIADAMAANDPSAVELP
jgi:hypothetical protein